MSAGGPPATSTDPRAELLRTLAAACIVIAGLKLAAGLLVPVLLAAFFALALTPVTRWFQARGLPAALAIALSFSMGLVLIVGLGLLVAGSMADVDAKLPVYEARLEEIAADVSAGLRERGIEVPDGDIVPGVEPAQLLDLATTVVSSVGAALSNSIVVLLAMLFMMFETAALTGEVRPKTGAAVGNALDRVVQAVTDYLSVKTLISLLTGFFFGLACWLIGLDFPLLWGLLAYLLNYIPNVGSAIAAVPPTLLALIQLGPGAAALVLGSNVLVNGVLGNVVEPKLMGQKVGLSTLTVFLGLIFWSWVFGPVGTILSVPLTIVAKMLFDRPAPAPAATDANLSP